MKRIITLAMIDKLRPHRKEYNLMDREQLGFGVRVRSTGYKSFIFKRRIDGNLISQTLGEVDKIRLDQARKMASDLMHNIKVTEYEDGLKDAKMIAPPDKGYSNQTFASFVTETFWPWALSKWKPGSIDASETYMRTQLIPNFGRLQMDEITNRHIAAWFDKYSATSPGGANRALDDLKVIFAKAVQWECMHANPIINIRKNPKRKMTRFLSRAEITRLSEVLVELEGENAANKQPANIVRLLLLTGCRHREITTLKWDHIKENVAHLPDSKSGPREVHLSDAAMAILHQIKADRDKVPDDRRQWVFPNPQHFKNQPARCRPPIWYFWKHVCARAGFGPTRIHDLRHTFASQAALNGHGLIAVKNMLGHKSLNMTLAYVHVHDPEAAQAAVKMANILCGIMAGKAVDPYHGSFDGPPDKGLEDTGPSDARPSDTGPPDRVPDTGPPDRVPDTGPPDRVPDTRRRADIFADCRVIRGSPEDL